MSLTDYPLIADWITEQDGQLLIHTGKVDIGQRISTALAQIAHEELTIPHDRITVAPVRTGISPDEGMTSGSNSVEQSGHALRCAAATLRRVLTDLAVAQNGGSAKDWALEHGVLHLTGTNHRLSVIDMIAGVPADARVDPAAAFSTRAGLPPPEPPMRGLAAMVRGQFTFVQDLQVQGMFHARVIRPPHAHARLVDIDATAIDMLVASGLRLIRDGSFLAIAGPKEWPVVKAAAAFPAACRWDRGPGLSEGDIFARMTAENATRLPILDATPQRGDIPPPLATPAYSARYERPYQMHAPLAPSAALAVWDGKVLALQCQSQGIYPLRASIADSLGLAPDQVQITHVPGSGCYGHTGADDAGLEAALIAQVLPNTPILLKWTREDEHAWEPYAPAMAVEIAAEVDGGRVTRFSAEAFSDTHRGRPRPGANRAGPSRLLANRLRQDAIPAQRAQPNMGRHAGMHRNLDPVYDFAETRLVKNLVHGLPHRTSAMRCLGAVANIFAIECTMEDLAREQGVAPLIFRRDHLSDRRALAVLDELERRMGDKPTGETAGRGIAYAQYKNQMTRVGVCVDLTVDDMAHVHLTHVTIVADAGRIVDAQGLTAQLEGGFIQAASWALHEQVLWDRDGILTRDWQSYPVIRFDAIPTIAVTLIDRPDCPSVGAGEASPGPAVAAIANAIHDATGMAMRRMPFTPEVILAQALLG